MNDKLIKVCDNCGLLTLGKDIYCKGCGYELRILK